MQKEGEHKKKVRVSVEGGPDSIKENRVTVRADWNEMMEMLFRPT